MRNRKARRDDEAARAHWARLGALIVAGALFSLGLRSAVGAARPVVETVTTPIIWTDVDGHGYGPLQMRAAPATVFVFFSTQCPVANQYMPRLRALDDSFTPRGVRFFMVDSHALDGPDQARAFIRERQLFIPIVKDTGPSLADRRGATV